MDNQKSGGQTLFAFCYYIEENVKFIEDAEQSASSYHALEAMLVSGYWQDGIRKPGEFAKMQSPGEDGLIKFFGAAAPQHRRSVPIKGGFGGGNPNKIDLGSK